MLSKNNRQYQQQRQAQRVPHYGLRKLSVGVASVLLSTTLYMGVTAQADTVAEANPQPTTDQPASAESDTSTGGATANTHVLRPTADQPASAAANNSTSENDANTLKQPVNTVDIQSTSGNSGMTSENVINSAVDAKADSNMPAQPLTEMSATSDNKQADVSEVNTASPVRPKLRLAVSQPVTKNTDTSDVNVDLTNYWKQPADMTKATSAGGHTDWLDNGPNYVDAKVTDFKATMYKDNATLSTKDWYRIGYQISFDTDTTNLQPGKILHLFRLTETSDTGYLPMISPDNPNVSVQWNGKNLGIIHSSFHNIKTHEGSNDLTDYIDINLEITAKMDGVGNQHVTLSVPWNNILNYYRPYSWREAPETNKVTLVVTNNDFKYTKESTWKLGQTEYSPMTSKDHWITNSYLPMDVSSGLVPSGAANIWFNMKALAYVDANTARAFYNSGAKMPLTISDGTKIRGGYRIYTNNGNKLVLEGKVGDTTRIYPGRVTYPIVLPDGTVTSRGQDYDNSVSYPMPGADLGLAEIVNQNLTLTELKALNKTGLVVSAQDDGSINAYLNLPVAGMRQHDTPVNRQWMYTEIMKHSVGVNYSKYAANTTELKQLLKNTVDYYFNGPTKGLPLSFGVNIPKLVYHLANRTEPTKVIAASIADHSLAEGAVAETRTTTYTPNLAKISGQSAVRFHYVSGFNAVEIQTGDTAVGKPDSPVKLPTFPTIKGYTRRVINAAGAAIKLGNGSTLNLPAGSQVLVDGSALNFGDENTWHDYYVVYDPVFVSKSYRFIDDINSKPVGSDTSVKGYYNQTIKTGLVVPTVYKLAANQILPTQVTLDVDDTAMTLIHLIHQAVAVTPDHPQANGTKLPENPTQSFHGVEASDLNKTATRTIKVTTPDGQTKTVTQNVKLTRTATVDEVTGEITYGDWSTGQWDAYKVSTVAGYTATQTAVAAVSVNEHTTDQTVDVSYTANPQTTTVKYVDDKGKVVHTTTIDGVTNQTVKVPSEVPAGWTITKGQVPSELTFDANGHKPIEVKVAHHRVTVDPDHPQTNGTKLPDNPAKTFNGVEANDLNKTATRTIKVTQPNGTTTNKVQTAKLTRSADVDEVTGKVAYGDWTTGEWAAYDTPSIAGYTTSQTKIDKKTVTAALKDTTVEITYTPNQHQISVEYIDDDAHGKIVKTDQVPGKTDQTITVAPSAPANYNLVDNGNRTYTVTSGDGQRVQIHVKHRQVTTSESKAVTRTINVHTPHNGVKTVKQTVDLTRNVITDQVTGEKTYGDWTTGQWKVYTPDAIPGYTRSANEVPTADVDGSSTEQTIDITYTANTQHIDIVYVDDAKGGAVVKTDQVAGKTDETVKVTPDVPASYQIVSEVPGDYTITADGHQTITVHLAHQMKTTSESKAVTRTINVNTPHDGTTIFKQTVDLTRDVTTDQVTGDKTYGDWSVTKWTHYDVPAVAGYTPSMKQVAQQVVNGATTDQTADVTYTANDQTTHVNYVDGDGNTVHATTITGKTDQTVKVPNETPTGWKVVGESVPTEITFGPDGHADVAITVDHQHVTVTPDQPKTPNDKLPNNPGKTYPDGVGRNDLNRTVTRTIKVTTPDGQTKTVTQKVQLTQTADIDEVTGKVTYGKWTTGEWTAVEIPTINGYTPSTTIPAQTVDYDTKDKTVAVNYVPNQQQQLVKYVDDAGHIIHTTTLTGVTDQTVAVPNEVPTNWKLVNPSSLPNKVELSASGNQPIVVTIKHQVLTVQPDQAKTPADHLPDGSSYPGGVDKDSLNKTVTRTIKVTAPDHTVNTVTQTAKLHRTATIDLVTKTVTYGDWSTDQWNQYKAPTIAGYTTTPTVIATQPVTKDTENQTVTVNYQAQAQSITVKYQEPNGQVVKTEKLTGYTDQPLTIMPDVPNGYELVPGQKLTYTPTSAKDQSVVIQLQHKLATTKETQPVTRTIKITQPNGQQQTIKQTVTLHRTVTVDQVTHEKTYGNWSTAQWDSYQVPVIDGYTPSQKTVAETTVTSPNQSTTVDVDYQANEHTTTIKYVDSTDKVVHTTTVQGHTDQTVKVPNETPAGWQVVNNSLPNELHFGTNGHVGVTVTVQHRTVTVQADQPVPDGTPLPNNPAQHYHGVEEKDLNKTITRTIKVTNPAGQTTTTTQRALLNRSATIDEVTGDITYGDWSTGQLIAFVPPVVDGYTPSLPEIANQAVTAESKDKTIAITYAANPQTAKIQYKDKAGTILHEQIVHGKTGETIKVPSEVPAGWRLVNGQKILANITFGAHATEPVTVTAEHATVTVLTNQPKTPADSLPDDPTKNYPSGVGVNDLNQTLTRTITIKAPGQAPQTITQPAHLMRSAMVDEVTGEVTYSDWSTDEWPAVTVPSVPGYTPNITTISAQTVTDETKPTTITVNYAPNEHTTQLQYVDDKGVVIKTVPLHGVTGETVTVPTTLPAGWVLTPTTKLPSTITMTANGHPKVVATVQHGKVTVTPNHPKTTADKLPDNPSKNYPSGVAENDLNKTVTRTIKMTDPTGKVTTEIQTVHLTRTATIDEITGQVTYSDWTTGKWNSYSVPEVSGYTAITKSIDEVSVDSNTKDQTVEVTYTANSQSIKINYVDDDKVGVSVKSDTLNGKTDQTVKTGVKIPDGYVVSGNVPTDYTFKATDNADITVHLIHNKVTVTPDSPKTTADKLPDNPAKAYPDGVSQNDLNKSVTRIINVTDPKGKVTTEIQTVHLTRTATVDEVTGQVTYSDWTTGSFDSYDVPSVDGYTASQDKVDTDKVTSDTQNSEVNISYTANSQSIKINYVDGDNGDSIVKTDTLTGKTDETIKTGIKVPDGYVIDGNVPDSYTFKAKDNTDITVKLKHGTITVTANNPKTINDKLPDNPTKSYPEGIGQNDLNKTVTRAIKVTTPDGETTTTIQTVHLTRTATVDEVTGKVTYGDWSTGSFDSYVVPSVDGYTASQDKVDTATVTSDTQNREVNITYIANQQSIKVNYVDSDNGGAMVKSEALSGKTDETIKTKISIPDGYVVEGQVPTDYTFKGKDNADITVKLKHGTTTVTADNPKTTNNKLPDNPSKSYPSGVAENDLNKTVTRTIKIADTQGEVTTTTQTVHLTRTATVDEVTGKVTYGDWTTGSFDSYDVPSVEGYTASQDKVDTATVTSDTQNSEVNITYTANPQSIQINYVDDDKGGATVKSDTLNGKTDETVNTGITIPENYTVVGTAPSDYTFKAKDNADITVHLKHVIDTKSEEKTITRTIKVTNPNGGVMTIPQSAKSTRTVSTDKVTGEVTYGDWSKATLDGYDVPLIEGYTASQPSVATTTVDGSSEDNVVEINYTPNKQVISIDYVDNDKVIATQVLTGKTDETVKTNIQSPDKDKYVVVGTNPESYKFKAKDNADIRVEVKHVINDSTESKDVTRTIVVTSPDGKETTKVQKATVSRTMHTDAVTGDKTYDEWSKATLDKYNVPTVDGYTPSLNVVEGLEVDGNNEDSVVKVGYTANPQSIKVNYVDEDNGSSTVKTKTLNGKTDQTVKTDIEIPDEYVVEGQVPTDYTFKAKDNADITVKLKHGTTTVTADNPKTTDDKLTDNPSKSYPSGVGQNDLNKDVTRTIKVTDPTGKVTTETQTVHLTRNATVDEVTGNVTYGDWTTGSFDSYDVPSVEGYTASQDKVERTPVTADSTNSEVNISYTANDQSIKINYVDNNGGTTVKSDTLNGKTDQTVKTGITIPDGYVVDGNVPTDYTFKAKDNADITVHLTHNNVTVTADKPKTTNAKLPDNPSKNYPSGVAESDLNKDIIRTINVTTPDGKTSTTIQTVHLTRNATVDEVTGDVTYSDWTTGSFDSYDVPSVEGYTASQDKVDTANVTSDTQDSEVNITYTANPQSIQINYVDDDKGGATVKSETLDGKTDQTVKTGITIPENYTVVGTTPSDYTFKAKDKADITVHLKHVIDTKPEKKTITRTIKVTSPKGGVMTIPQSAKSTRTVSTDKVTGEVTYGDWSKATLEGYDVPEIEGYTASQPNVDQTTVNGNVPDSEVNITYTANKQVISIDYVDNGKVISTQILTGKTDETVETNIQSPNKDKYVMVGTNPDTYTFKAKDNEDVKVEVKHVINDSTESKDVTRTIVVTSPDGKETTKVQKATVSRTVHTDAVTGAKTYDEWSKATLDKYKVPTVDGYTPSINVVEGLEVDGNNEDSVVKVGYTANEQTAKIVYVDGDNGNSTVKTDILSGKTDQTVETGVKVPDGYTVEGSVPDSYTFKAKDNADITVKLKHGTTTVTPDKPKTTNDKLPNNPTKSYPSGVAENDLNKDVTRTIKVTDPKGKVTTKTQTVHLTRTATVDEVTGKVTYGDWSTGTFDNYDVPVIEGYTPNVATISAQTVTDETKPTTITVNYAPNEHTTQLQYVDEKGAVIKTVPLHGVTGETISVPTSLPAGWVLTPTTKVPAKITMTTNGHPKVVATVQHGKVTVTPDKPKTTADTLPDDPTKNYPSGVGVNDLNQTLTRTITIKAPGQAPQTITQPAHLMRNATVNEVTGEVTYSDWSTDKWPAVTVPSVPGYTPSTKTISAQTVTDETKPTTITVNYAPNEHTTQLQYVDEKGAVIKTVPLKGVTGETVTVPKNLPAGWILTPTTKLPETITMTANGHPAVIVTVQHGKVTVIPDKPKTTADLLPDNPNNHYPTGVGENDLNKTLTRTINLTVPGQKARTITKTVTIHRSATVDEVTGEVTYSDWSTAEWPAVNVPNVQGYTPSTKTIPAQTATDKIKNTTVTVNYTADEHTTQLQYVNENGAVIKTVPLHGVTGETVTVPKNLPAGWVLTPTTKVPTTITMTANGHPAVIVTVQHGKVTVIPDKPKTTADPLPDNPYNHYPTGVGETDLNQTLTRTINFMVPGQKARTITQTVTVHRSATVDEVTGEVTYSDWSKAEWPEVNVPSVQGYTPNQTTVPAEVASADHGDQTVTIAYHKDSVPNKTEKQTSTVKTKTVEPTKPMPATETTTEKHQSETKSMPTKATNTTANTLPQTGDAKNAATWLGVINMLFTGLVGWWTKKKHKPQA